MRVTAIVATRHCHFQQSSMLLMIYPVCVSCVKTAFPVYGHFWIKSSEVAFEGMTYIERTEVIDLFNCPFIPTGFCCCCWCPLSFQSVGHHSLPALSLSASVRLSLLSLPLCLSRHKAGEPVRILIPAEDRKPTGLKVYIPPPPHPTSFPARELKVPSADNPELRKVLISKAGESHNTVFFICFSLMQGCLSYGFLLLPSASLLLYASPNARLSAVWISAFTFSFTTFTFFT